MSIVRVILSDSKLINEYSFTVTVKNNAPYFEHSLRDLKLSLNSDYEYLLPPITDKEKLPFKVLVSLSNGHPLPSLVKFDEARMAIMIERSKKSSTHIIKVCLDDNYSPPNCYFFTIKIENIRVRDSSGS